MTWDHLHATLTSLLELEFYALYLCSSPQRSACLLVETEAAEMQQVQATVLNEMKDEWNMLQEMEGNREMHALLRKECPFVFFHHFREVPVCFAQHEWKMCPDTFSCVQAWFPRFSFSSNIEDVFSSLQDACRRGVKNGDAGLSNLQCVSVRAIQQKMDVEGGPKLVQLESEDYEGNAVRSAEIRIDDVLKPYETTSAYNHCKSQLNFLKGLRLAKKSGRDLLEASESFWISAIMQRGQLLQIGESFYLCVGGAPAVLYVPALPLEELRLLFDGPVPQGTQDESQMLAQATRYAVKDPLLEHERVKALVIKIRNGQHPLQAMLLDDIANVRVFSYTVHWLPASYSAKLGVSLCLRRAASGLPPVVDMVKSKAIVRLTSEQLSKLLGAHGVTARKSSTKTFKTRQLMQLPLVTQHCSQEELTALDDLLKQIDAKRRKQPKEEQQGDEDEEEAPIGEIVRFSEKQAMLVLRLIQAMAQALDEAGDQAHDPAVEFAEQMLGQMPDTEAGIKIPTHPV
ncbi:hemA [Symbiodinium sp. CCMP2592]|nr:hemA [Symbiodinium sp. CCMP2592]